MSLTTNGTGFGIGVQLQGREKALVEKHGITGRKLDQILAKAINDTAFEIRKAYRDEISSVFDRPTDYIKDSVWVKKASEINLVASIDPVFYKRGGVEPTKILKAQALGGRRRDKRSEVALRQAGYLPTGYQVVIPPDPFPGSEDAHGNIKGKFMQQLLSYLQAYERKEGSKNKNMNERRKAEIARNGGGRTKVMGPHLSRRYFVIGVRSQSHLSAGVWAALGNGVTRQVLAFRRMGDYQVLLRTESVGKRADAETYLNKRIRHEIYDAFGRSD